MDVTLWLIWSLVAGQPADVDSFLNRDQCEASLLQGMTNLERNVDAAKAGNAPKEVLDKLNAMSFYGCTEAHVTLQRKES